MERAVRTSAKALVIKDGCMLAIKLRDQDGDFYIMPGGGQMPGELLPMAVEREVAEETGISVHAKDVVFVIEGAEGEPHHRVDIETLNHAPLYPSKLRRPIMNLYAGNKTSVYLGNENLGDPEEII